MGVFPNEFKQAIVTPLYKNKGSIEDLTNFRTICTLPPINKIFEKILVEQMRLYFDMNGLFFAGQHGFRKFHSCESALHELLTKCFDNMDKRLINMLLFIDFKKAFDVIDWQLLLVKLLNYGFSNSAIRLIVCLFH